MAIVRLLLDASFDTYTEGGCFSPQEHERCWYESEEHRWYSFEVCKSGVGNCEILPFRTNPRDTGLNEYRNFRELDESMIQVNTFTVSSNLLEVLPSRTPSDPYEH